MRKFFYTLLFLPLIAWGQTFNISGKIAFRQSNEPIANGIVALQGTKFQSPLQDNGNFSLKAIPQGKYVLIAFAENAKTYFQEIELNSDLFLNIVLDSFENEIEAITVQAERERLFGLTRLKSVENFGIYEGKKSEVIEMENLTVNFATNNARQIFSRITGLNIWESDQAGLQLGTKQQS